LVPVSVDSYFENKAFLLKYHKVNTLANVNIYQLNSL
jgi:hypothetical protein